jgi:hypothetical protein
MVMTKEEKALIDARITQRLIMFYEGLIRDGSIPEPPPRGPVREITDEEAELLRKQDEW